jgi:ATP-dependent DNA helicase RecG
LVDELVDRLVVGLVDELVDSQQKIIQLIAANPKISKREMSNKIGISSTAIDKNIKSLKDKKIIKRIGSDRSGHWEIIDQTNN